MTTPHRDASLLRAIADGKQMQTEGLTAPWADASGDEALTALAEGQPCRIKPEFVLVNGAECPKPIKEIVEAGFVEVSCYSNKLRLNFDSWKASSLVFDAMVKPFKECQE